MEHNPHKAQPFLVKKSSSLCQELIQMTFSTGKSVQNGRIYLGHSHQTVAIGIQHYAHATLASDFRNLARNGAFMAAWVR